MNAKEIGALFFFLEMATAAAGEFLEINAFDQPGVEAGKIATFALMGSEGYEEKAANSARLRERTGNSSIRYRKTFESDIEKRTVGTMKGRLLKYLPEMTSIYLISVRRRKAYEFFGCHYIHELKMHRFCVQAPNARNVSVGGTLTAGLLKTPMEFYKNGVWAAFVPELKDGENYKYMVYGYDGSNVLKADPFAFHCGSETANGV